jgi:hypothetical protein
MGLGRRQPMKPNNLTPQQIAQDFMEMAQRGGNHFYMHDPEKLPRLRKPLKITEGKIMTLKIIENGFVRFDFRRVEE